MIYLRKVFSALMWRIFTAYLKLKGNQVRILSDPVTVSKEFLFGIHCALA